MSTDRPLWMQPETTDFISDLWETPDGQSARFTGEHNAEIDTRHRSHNPPKLSGETPHQRDLSRVEMLAYNKTMRRNKAP